MAKKDDVGEGSGLSDEEWAEFEKQFTKEATKTAAYKEPSARQRELTAKWKKEAPKETGWRTDGPRTPMTPGSRPTLTVLEGGKKRSVWRRNVAWALLAAIITGLVIGLPKLFHRSSDDAGTKTNGQTAYVTPQSTGQASTGPAALGAPPASAAAEASSTAPTSAVTDPFAGSPAADYANGADGIVLPQSGGVGGYSAKQVADAMAQAKQFLVVANLDSDVLMGASPDRLIQMMDPKESLRGWLANSLKHPDEKDDPTNFVTRFAKAETKLASPTVKVHGSMAPGVDKNGNLKVSADYLFVYGVEAADGSGDPTREVVRRVLTIVILNPAHYQVTPGKVWIEEYTDQVDNSPCGIYDGFLHPWFPGAAQAAPTTPAPSATASGTAAPATPSPTAVASFDPFDQSKPVAGDSDKFACTSATRT